MKRFLRILLWVVVAFAGLIGICFLNLPIFQLQASTYDTTTSEYIDYESDFDETMSECGDEDGLDSAEEMEVVATEIAALIREIAGDVKLDDCFVKLDKPFFGFPWLRIDTAYAKVGPGLVARGCGAEMVFEAAKPSEYPLRKIKELQNYIVGEKGLALVRESNDADSYSAMARSKGAKYKFYMHSGIGKLNAGGKRYTIGFEVERIIGKYEYRKRNTDDEFHHSKWEDVAHETIVKDVEEASAWRYEIERGRSSEELLDEWIAKGDRSILKSGYTTLGMCIGVGTNSYTACTEAEAELYCIFSGCYMRRVDRTTQMRLYHKLIQPNCFRKGRTEPTQSQIGAIFWDVIPGDKITWYEEEKRNRVGIVVREDEEGEYWGPIKAKVKVVVDEELATKDDWKPTALDKEYKDKRRKVMVKADNFRRLPGEKNEEKMLEILSSFVSEMRPGSYHQPMTYHIYDGATPTKEYVRKKMLWWESVALNDWQYELRQSRNRVLEEYQGLHSLYNRGRPGDDTIRRWGLSRREAYMLKGLPGWHELQQKIGRNVFETEFNGIGFRSVNEQLQMPDREGVEAQVVELKDLAAIRREKNSVFWTGNRSLKLCRAFELVLENEESPETKAITDAALSVVKAHPSDGVLNELCVKLTLEYGEDPRTWNILRAMRKNADRALGDTLDKIFDSRWCRYCSGISKEVEIPIGGPYDHEVVYSQKSDFSRKQIIPIPYKGETNAFIYVYWNDKGQTSRVSFYTRRSNEIFRHDFDADKDLRSFGDRRVFKSFEWKDTLDVPRFRLRWVDPRNDNTEYVDYKLVNSGFRREY